MDELVPGSLRASHGGYRSLYGAAPRARMMGGGGILAGLRGDGSTFSAEIALSPLPGVEGPDGVIAVVRDVSDREELSAGARRTETRFRAVVEQTADGVWVLDADGETVFANARLGEILGRDAKGLLGRSPLEFVAADGVVEATERLAAGKAMHWDVTLLHAEGGAVPVRCGVSPLVADDGITREGSVLVVADLTDVQAAAAERAALLEAHAQAQTMEAVGLFASGIAHDFNAILTIVLGYADLLRARDLDDDSRQLVSTILDAAEHGRTVTQQLLALGREGTGKVRPLDPVGVLESMSSLLRSLLPDEVDLKLDLASDTGKVRIARGALEQVVLNLVANARDAMAHGGRLLVQTRRVSRSRRLITPHGILEPGAYARLRVADSGEGIDESLLRHVFQPFVSGGASTGLGLATVYGVATRTGGLATVRSAVGSGTTFDVYLAAA